MRKPLTITRCDVTATALMRRASEIRVDWAGIRITAWSESTPESAIRGTVDECVAQLRRHVEAGVQHLIFIPYKYHPDQVEILAKEVIPRLRG